MKRNLDSKGFAVSPFVIIALILLGAILAVHFTKIDDTKSRSIAREGELNKAILNIEEPKATLQSLVLFSAYQAAYKAGRDGISDKTKLKKFLSDEIAEDLNSYESDILATPGNFRVGIDDSDKMKGFRVHTSPEGTKKVGVVGDVVMSSTVGVDKFVGARIFLLRDLVESDIKGKFVDDFRNKLEDKLPAGVTCTRNKNGYDIYCYGEISPPPNPPSELNNPKYPLRLLEDSVIDMEEEIAGGKSTAFSYIIKKNCTLEFKPKKLDVKITKEYDGGWGKSKEECEEECTGICDREARDKCSPKVKITRIDRISSISYGSTLRISVTIRNSGSMPITYGDKLKVMLYIDGSWKTSTRVSTLGVGKSKTVTLRYKPKSRGTHRYKVRVKARVDGKKTTLTSSDSYSFSVA